MTDPSLSHIIQRMLFGLGDCRKPRVATSCIIEEHLQQQLDFIVYKAQAFSGNQENEEISVKHIMFLMKDNPIRIARAYNYFDIKSQQQKITGGISGTATSDIDIEADLKSLLTENKKSRNQSVKQQILEFLEEMKMRLDSEYVDKARHERLVRQNELSLEHSTEDYLHFENSRCVSFDSSQNKRIFNEWLRVKLRNNPGISLLTSSSYELLQFLAKEIVAQIVDYAIVLRANAKAQTLSISDLTSTSSTPRPEAAVFPIMPDEVNEVMRRCNYMHKKPYQNVSFCIIF